MGRVSDAKEKLLEAMLELIWTGSYGGTTIDHICDKAGVKRGSFYYFFESKTDLAIASLDALSQKKRAELDAVFSPTVPPLERLRNFCEGSYRKQVQMQEKYGRVLGCPHFSLGAEVCMEEQKLRLKIQEILERFARYFETAIRDAHSAGLIKAPDAAAKARMLRAYFEGLMTQARIQNDVEVLREMPDGMFAILGVQEKETVAA
jgi:TetR/AcrR family transcriptional repressor of nem operon